MTVFAVSGSKNRWLQEKMKTLGIQDKDLDEKFVRSSGRGGQKVNKTSTCVYLKHRPTGIEVKCMRERSQSVNRFLARREMLFRIERHQKGQSAGDLVREIIGKQKRRRRKRSLEKYLREDA